MRLLSETIERLRALLLRAREDRELDEELRRHLEMQIEENVRRGMDPKEARRRAHLKLGGVEQTKEQVRRARGTRRLEDLAKDLRHAARGLRRAPGFATAAVLTLALGIGAATTIYTLFDSAYLRALPYPDADRLVALWQDRRGQGGPAEARFNPPDFDHLRDESRSLVRVAAMTGWNPTLGGTARPERLRGLSVSHEYFALFGARPAVGRTFRPAEETPEGEDVVVLSHDLWQRRFLSDPSIVGTAVELDGARLAVVGVAPADFRPPGGPVEIWRPLRSDPGALARRFRILDVVGRLAPGATPASARAELAALAAEVADAYPRSNAGVTFRAAPLEERVLGPIRPALYALLGAVGLLLSIACVNVAGLLLARGAVRAREVAVRRALGGRRGRLVRQFLAEGLLLGALGGAAGLLLALGGVRLLGTLLPAEALPGAAARVDPRAVGVALALSVLTTLAFAIVPAFRASDIGFTRALEAGGHRSTAAARSTRARGVLVVGQIALSLVLLIGAGLLARSFTTLLAVEPGFRPDRVLTAELTLPSERYPGAADVSRFYDRLLRELRRRPGARAAAATSFLPLRGAGRDVSLRVENRPVLSPDDDALAWYRVVTPDYFRALGIPVVRGRGFTEADARGAADVLVVSEMFARRYLSDGRPVIGRRVSPDWADGRWFTVVGVVGDVRHDGLAERVVPEIYYPHAQLAGAARSMTLVVRTGADPAGFAPALLDAVRTLDPDLPVERVATMRRIVGASLALPRLHLWAFAAFAAVALLLAGVGLYGVIATVVALRRREIGVRMAIGARPGDILRWVLRRAFALVLAGTFLGLAAALALSRTLESVLHAVSPLDATAYAAAGALLAGAALLAALLPARRAARLDPATVLNAE